MRRGTCRVAASGIGKCPPYLSSGNLAKRNNDISVVRDYQRLGAFLELPRPFRSEQDELKAAGNFVQTIFNGYSGHNEID
jgi:hypothetical protein